MCYNKRLSASHVKMSPKCRSGYAANILSPDNRHSFHRHALLKMQPKVLSNKKYVLIFLEPRSDQNDNDGRADEDDGVEPTIPEREIILADQFCPAKRKNRHTCARPTM